MGLLWLCGTATDCHGTTLRRSSAAMQCRGTTVKAMGLPLDAIGLPMLHGIAMRLPCGCQSTSRGLPWGFYYGFMGRHGTTMASWHCHGTSMRCHRTDIAS